MTSKSILLPTLSLKNSHPRDKNLVFDEPTHKYTITTDPSSSYTSVTTWNHSHFPHFDADEIISKMMKGKNWNAENKYWGKTPEEIKAGWTANAQSVSGAGTDLHFDIECFMNQDLSPNTHLNKHIDLLANYKENLQSGKIQLPNDSEEWQYFLQFAKQYPELKPYRTEWMIYHEDLKLAGSIDMVYELPDGALMIYDWKRAKEISKTSGFNQYALTPCIDNLPNTNFWHYSLQLNTYKAILEAKYDKKITDLYLVRLHPNNPRKSFDLIKCADLSAEIAELFEERRKEVEMQTIERMLAKTLGYA
uniref:Uncharacterized protein n=1 Tax=viral metagenome TaxID=1070528 RepID=A0A6C0EVI1_9ZZZZ